MRDSSLLTPEPNPAGKRHASDTVSVERGSTLDSFAPLARTKEPKSLPGQVAPSGSGSAACPAPKARQSVRIFRPSGMRSVKP
jgi:hypothetical protein